MDSTVVLFLHCFQAGLSPFPVCTSLKELVNRLPELGWLSCVFLLVSLFVTLWPFKKQQQKKGSHICLSLQFCTVSPFKAKSLVHWEMLQETVPLKLFAVLHQHELSISWNKTSLLISKSIHLFYRWWIFEQTIPDNGTVESLDTYSSIASLLCFSSYAFDKHQCLLFT